MATTFYIVRHGESENNKHKLLSGWFDTPLTDLGRQNAADAAKKLAGIDFDSVYSSDLIRATETADIIAKNIGLSGPIHREPALREVNYGELANQPFSVYPDITAEENSHFRPVGGESLTDMHARIMPKIYDIARLNPGKTILIAGHDGTINAARASLTGESPGQADTVHNPQDTAFAFQVEDGKVISFEEVKAREASR